MESDSLYLEYFGLNSEPFGLTPDPRFFFDSSNHVESLARLLYALEQKEMALVIGDVGTGKTLLSRCLVDALDEQRYKLCWIINPSYPPCRFFQEVCEQLFGHPGGNNRSTLIDNIQTGMLELYSQGIHPVILIDEAQEIPTKKIFDDIRLLTNFQTDAQNLISVVFFGQMELLRRLQRPPYRSLLERIRYVVTLQPFSLPETTAYLRHRLKVAGGRPDGLFTEEAIGEIQRLSGGYPRRINHLATFALLEAMGEDQTTIDIEIVRRAAREIPYLRITAN